MRWYHVCGGTYHALCVGRMGAGSGPSSTTHRGEPWLCAHCAREDAVPHDPSISELCSGTSPLAFACHGLYRVGEIGAYRVSSAAEVAIAPLQSTASP